MNSPLVHKFAYIAASVPVLLVGLWAEAPIDGGRVVDAHSDEDLLRGLALMQEPDPALAAALAEFRSVKRARRWLAGLGPAERQHVLASDHSMLAGTVARRDPYRLPGCTYVGTASPGELPDFLRQPWPHCESSGRAAVRFDRLVPDAADLHRALAAMQSPRRHKAGRTQVFELAVPGTDLKTALVKGPDSWMGIRPDMQLKAQRLVEELTGNAPDSAHARFDHFEEGARARMMGVLVVDVATARIEAAASASSPCHVKWHLQDPAAPRSASAGCPLLPAQQVPNRLKLRNHALHYEGMPGSEVKAGQAMALMQEGVPHHQIAPLLLRSDTEGMIDLLFCKESEFHPACAARRVERVRLAAAALAPPVVDVLTGNPGIATHAGFPLPGARMLGGSTPSGFTSSAAALKDCYADGSRKRWRGCSGASLVNTVAELFGQGNARTTPVGLAAQWVRLANAANGAHQPLLPHLLVNEPDLQDPGVSWQSQAQIKPAHAKAFLDALTSSIVTGTSHASCMAALAYPLAGAKPSAMDCKTLAGAIRVAAKTGTPLFPADQIGLDAWRDQCAEVARQRASPPSNQAGVERLRHADTRCRVPPVKWWAAAVGDASGWKKVVVVVSERNFLRNGRIDAAGDTGPNVSAEAGLVFIHHNAAELLATPGKK